MAFWAVGISLIGNLLWEMIALLSYKGIKVVFWYRIVSLSLKLDNFVDSISVQSYNSSSVLEVLIPLTFLDQKVEDIFPYSACTVTPLHLAVSVPSLCSFCHPSVRFLHCLCNELMSHLK